MKIIYKIIYPNGKIYIGQGRTEDFAREDEQSVMGKREILWESATASRSQVNKKEIELIREHRANDPTVGYNRWPKFKVKR